MGAQIKLVPASFSDAYLHVVLVEPEIPQNTGNIARLCAGTNAWLHLVKPLGYKLEDRYLKRAGLDYWPSVRLSTHESLGEVEQQLPRERTHVFSTRASASYWQRDLARGSVLLFGCETRGVPDEFWDRWSAHGVRIPTTGDVRSLNLANSVAIATYECLRASGFDGA